MIIYEIVVYMVGAFVLLDDTPFIIRIQLSHDFLVIYRLLYVLYMYSYYVAYSTIQQGVKILSSL